MFAHDFDFVELRFPGIKRGVVERVEVVDAFAVIERELVYPVLSFFWVIDFFAVELEDAEGAVGAFDQGFEFALVVAQAEEGLDCFAEELTLWIIAAPDFC